MKIRRLIIDGLRGCPRSLELKLNGKSMSVLAENGFGKTTVADACELWSKGDLATYHKEGARLDAAISIHAERALVTVQPESYPALARGLSGNTVTPIEVQGPEGDFGTALPGEIPLLRHRTMADFMERTAGQKKKALLELLGLDDLTQFRATVASGSRKAAARVKEAKGQLAAAQQALAQASGDVGLTAKCVELSSKAGLSDAPQTETHLLATDLPALPAQPPNPRPALLAQFAAAVERLDSSAVSRWNDSLDHLDVARERGMHALLAVGQEVLSEWDHDSCPLCLVDQDRHELAETVTTRAATLARATAALGPHRDALQNHQEALRAAANALATLRDSPPRGGWASSSRMEEAHIALGQGTAAVERAVQGLRPCDGIAAVDASQLVVELEREVAADLPDDGPAKALVELASLKERCRAVSDREKELEAEETIAGAAKKLLELADEEINNTIEAHLAQMSSLIARYYERLHGSPRYSKVRLVYKPARDGGVEFAFEFEGIDVSPPQRVMSESQLNSLGLALFLARLQYVPQEWRTIVLDDVVNSFDANHRSGLARLLRDEFGDWQVLMLTHDKIFQRVLNQEVTGWTFLEIVQWDPAGGPVLSPGDPLARLQGELDAGVSASQLRGLARYALESNLEKPVSKLGLRIGYKANAAYTAHDYLTALREGLAKADGHLAETSILRDMATRTYLANLESHLRPDDSALGVGDLRQLVEDLSALREALKCGDCGEMVWYAERASRRGHYHCQCENLAV